MGAEALSLSGEKNLCQKPHPSRTFQFFTMKVLLLFSIIVVFICTLENVSGQDNSLEKREVEGERELIRKARETLPKKNEGRPKHKKMKGKKRKSKDSNKKKRRGSKGDKKARRREKGDKKDKKKMKK